MSDFTAIFGDWLTQSVGLKVLVGQSAEGVVHADAVTVDEVAVEDARRLVLDSDGRQVVSETTLYVPAGKAAMSPGDIVVLASREATVIRVADMAPFGLFDHRVVNLT